MHLSLPKASSDFSEFENYHVSGLQNDQNQNVVELAKLAKLTFFKKLYCSKYCLLWLIISNGVCFFSRIWSKRRLMAPMMLFFFSTLLSVFKLLFVRIKNGKVFYPPFSWHPLVFYPKFFKIEISINYWILSWKWIERSTGKNGG